MEVGFAVPGMSSLGEVYQVSNTQTPPRRVRADPKKKRINSHRCGAIKTGLEGRSNRTRSGLALAVLFTQVGGLRPFSLRKLEKESYFPA